MIYNYSIRRDNYFRFLVNTSTYQSMQFLFAALLLFNYVIILNTTQKFLIPENPEISIMLQCLLQCICNVQFNYTHICQTIHKYIKQTLNYSRLMHFKVPFLRSFFLIALSFQLLSYMYTGVATTRSFYLLDKHVFNLM